MKITIQRNLFLELDGEEDVTQFVGNHSETRVVKRTSSTDNAGWSGCRLRAYLIYDDNIFNIPRMNIVTSSNHYNYKQRGISQKTFFFYQNKYRKLNESKKRHFRKLK